MRCSMVRRLKAKGGIVTEAARQYPDAKRLLLRSIAQQIINDMLAERVALAANDTTRQNQPPTADNKK